MSKARDLADFSSVAPDIGRRNLIINGAMQVAQRGTVTGISSNSYGGPDRWVVGKSTTSAVLTAEQSTDAPTGFASSHKITVTTADATVDAGDLLRYEQRFEGYDLQHLKYGTADAVTLTASFWVKSNVTGTYAVGLYANDADKAISNTFVINSADTWEYKTVSFIGETTTSIPNDNTVSMRLWIFLMAGSSYTSGSSGVWGGDANRSVGHSVNVASSVSNYINLTGVQLEVGTVATPFEHRSYGEELALCQRYYQRLNASGNFTRYGNGYWANANTGSSIVHLTVPMRTDPSVDDTGTASDYYASSGNNVYALSSLPTFNRGTQTSDGSCVIANLNIESTGNGNAGQVLQLMSVGGGNSTGTFLGFEAEL